MKALPAMVTSDKLTYRVLADRNELSNEIISLSELGIEFDADLVLRDTRLVSRKQQKFARALAKEIAIQTEGSHYVSDFKYDELKSLFMDTNELTKFSMSDCSMSTANKFINYLIGYMLMNDLDVHKQIVDFEMQFTQQHLYMLLLQGKCFITGRKSNIHLHHVDQIGMANDRTNWKAHVGRKVMLLSEDSHLHTKAHNEVDWLLKQHHININHLPIVDEKLAKLIVSGRYKIWK